MAWLSTLLIVIQVLSAIAIIVLVLLQHGKGADMGAAFGSGSSGSLFGASGSANFLSRSTAVLATVFFLATLGLAYTGTTQRVVRDDAGVMGTMQKSDAKKAPESDKGADKSGAIPQSEPQQPVPAQSPAQPAPSKSGDIPK